MQDNWKVNRNLTLDYGVRLVHQTPQYDARGQASNFFVDKWNRSAAPVLYVAGCANGVYPCTGTNRQAMNPLTEPVPRTEYAHLPSAPSCRTAATRPTAWSRRATAFRSATYLQPALGWAPRFGMAYDLSGRQQIVLRGGGGFYFDRPSGNAVFGQVLNPSVAAIRDASLRTASDA